MQTRVKFWDNFSSLGAANSNMSQNLKYTGFRTSLNNLLNCTPGTPAEEDDFGDFIDARNQASTTSQPPLTSTTVPDSGSVFMPQTLPIGKVWGGRFVIPIPDFFTK